MTDSCEHCAGSGVLNIECSMTFGEWDEQSYASPCHACEMGKVWTELNLGDG